MSAEAGAGDGAAPSAAAAPPAAAAAPPGRASRHGPCASCGAAGRYRCPRCGRASCSAACVAAHKAAALGGCDGVRPAAEFVALKSMDDATLARDLRFLEGAQRCAERAARLRAAPPGAPRGSRPRPGADAGCDRLPPRALALREARGRVCARRAAPRPPPPAADAVAAASGCPRARHRGAATAARHGAAAGECEQRGAAHQGADEGGNEGGSEGCTG